MRFITVTELRQKATQIVSEIESTKGQIVVTKNGKPVVLMQIISNGNFTLNVKGKEVKGGGKRHLQKR
jgi:prevent-host-death family protein